METRSIVLEEEIIMDASHKLKALQTKRNSIKKDLDKLVESQKELSRQINKVRQELKEADEEIANFTSGNKKRSVIVSEHAMLRYFERMLGFNLDEIRDKILTPENETIIKHLKHGTFADPSGFKLQVKDNVVVTLF